MTIDRRYPELLRRLITIVKTSSQIHSQDVGFQRTIDSTFKLNSQQASSQLLELINQILDKSGSRKFELETIGDVKKNWPAIQTAVDTFVDRTKAAKEASSSSRTGSPAPPQTPTEKILYYDKTILKPQKSFNPPVDNSYGPFRPHLVDKPWAEAALNESLVEQPADKNHHGVWFKQPYGQEIERSSYPKFVYEQSNDLKKPVVEDIDKSLLSMVDTRKGLRKMIKVLSSESQIAVDLEHHDYRTYLGLTCLMQISTPTKDYIVDTLALRSELQDLNEVFCNPNILKVFHGARMDVLWLQRDLGLYVVGMFDTYYAARALEKARHSLAFLLESYCGFTANKQYQMADWRKRPLSKPMQEYARADTHFLLYVAQEMRNDLIQRGKLDEVLENSRKVASSRFEKPDYNAAEPGWYQIALKFRLNVNDHVLEAIYKWRDNKAREADESPRYIMANKVLADLVTTKPTTAEAVLSVCSGPSGFGASSLHRKSGAEIAELIQAASKLPPRPIEFATRRGRSGTPSAELFNSSEINALKSKRLETGTIFTTRNSAPGGTLQESKINLELIPNLSFQTVEKSDSEPDSEPEIVAVEPSPEPSPEPEADVRPKSNKRRINVVESLDDFDNFESKPSKKNKKSAPTEPAEAFDFGSAAPVMNKPKPRENPRKSSKKTTPGFKGVKQRTAKNAAKTVTYTKQRK